MIRPSIARICLHMWHMFVCDGHIFQAFLCITRVLQAIFLYSGLLFVDFAVSHMQLHVERSHMLPHSPADMLYSM